MPVQWHVPISNANPWHEPSVYSKRVFALVDWHWLSANRIELWYEEVLYA